MNSTMYIRMSISPILVHLHHLLELGILTTTIEELHRDDLKINVEQAIEVLTKIRNEGYYIVQIEIESPSEYTEVISFSPVRRDSYEPYKLNKYLITLN